MTRTSKFTANLGVVLAILVMASHAACRTRASPFAFTSKSEPENAASTAPVGRLWVYADVQSEYFDKQSYTGFEAGLTGRLADCGLALRVVPTAAPHPDDPARIELAPGEPAPTSVLTIAFVPSDSTIRRLYYRGVVTSITGTLYFRLTLFDVTSHKRIWLAKASFNFPSQEIFVDDELHGMRFASSLITTLQRDGMLDRCRVQEAYPGCLQERREIRLQASKTKDSVERFKLLQSVPSCK